MTEQSQDSPQRRKERDPDLAGVEAALIRAGKRARERARQAGIGVIVMKDGKIVEEFPENPV
ncbi:MAG: hypothetical protein JEZ02_14425 [Desulfatibacillum sp.]|nr:hypothetical protein [Desulfatibacillum sp.]